MNTIEQTYVSGIVCNKCQHTLRCHTMDEHLDINHPVHQCPSHDDVLLNENQKHRDNALDKFIEFIDGMIEDVKGKRPKNIIKIYKKNFNGYTISYCFTTLAAGASPAAAAAALVKPNEEEEVEALDGGMDMFGGRDISHDDVLINENQKHRDNALDKNKEIMQSANVNRDNHEEDEEYEENEEINQRRKWVEDYNNSLPQVKHYDEEFETELSVAVGGIYDSEYMNYVFDNIESKRIKDIKDLLKNQKRRENALDKYREFIDGMIEDVNGKRPKNIRYRKWLRNRLRYGAMTVFKTEEEEYQFIGKYGRGMWDMIDTAFKKQDQDIMKEFAYEYGAFDY